MSELKRCFKCGQTLPRTEFYKHPRMADGLLGKCKTCTKRDVKENEDKNEQRTKEYKREWGLRPESMEKKAAYRRTDAGKKAVRKSMANWLEKNPHKRSAQISVGNAIRDGKLVRLPCGICGNTTADAHHDDYSKPLEVRWLCRKHHAEWHRNNKPTP